MDDIINLDKTLAEISNEGGPPPSQEQITPSFEEEPEKPPKRIWKIISLMIAVFILIIASAGAYYYFFLYEKAEEVTTQSNQVTEPEDVSFELDLYKEINTKDKKDQNILISPFSVSTALMLAYNGADGKTAEEFKDLLGAKSLEESNKEYQAFLTDLNSDDQDVTIEIANSAWLAKRVVFLDSYVKDVETFLFSEVRELTTPEPINTWVDDKTKGKIEKIIDYIDPNQTAILVNAVYFNGKWSNLFAKDAIQELDFKTTDGKVKTEFLTQNGSYQYYGDKDLQSISLPYGESKRFQMEFYLPKKDDGLSKLELKLTDDNLAIWNKREVKEGYIKIPKFKFENDFQKMGETLQSMGLKEAFGPKADFSKMSKNFYSINKVIHKTYIDVNEEGTEAAASTAIVGTLGALESDESETFKFTADHPFLFILRDSQSDKILFIGRVSDPTE